MSVTKEVQYANIDGNEAAARIAHATNEVIAIYPITPASPMGELSDAWSAAGRKNLWGVVPEVVQLQSEGGAAGTVHGALQAGALTTTFTASQGLLLMIPNMFKIAGELTPTVFHIAARTLATHALSIFGDHSDVMSCRSTGWAMLASASVQEAQDLALVSHAATLKARVPFLHFFDGFRTSHEMNKIALVDDDVMRAMIDEEAIRLHRARSSSPDHPILRGSAQNPDVFFQAREACNPYYLAVPGLVQKAMDQFAALTGRRYGLFDYTGAPDAERVVVMMGSGVGATEEAVHTLNARGEKVGLVRVRLYRPFDEAAFIAALPRTVRKIAVLDRTKEPGAGGEPLYLDVVSAVFRAGPKSFASGQMPAIVGGRYGLSSKEYTPNMARSVFDHVASDDPKHGFTVGIVDDVTHLSLPWDRTPVHEADDVKRSVFYGLGSDGTVSATKSSVKIIGESTPMFAQGYFVYDSKKSGAITVSHLRFSPRPIDASYLIQRASFVGCHQFGFLEKMDVLETAEQGATFLLNSPYSAADVWDRIPVETQQQIIDKQLKFYVVDANKVAKDVGLGGRINSVMQTCFFALSGVLPREQAIEAIKKATKKAYEKRGKIVVEKNEAAIDASVAALEEVKVPAAANSRLRRLPPVPKTAPDFVQRVTGMIIEGKGDLLPVSALPVDGTFPTATAKYEKRSIAQEIPIWDPDVCTQCGLCPLVCPHAAIRLKAYPAEAKTNGAAALPARDWNGKEFPAGTKMTIQVAPDDCTGCGVCVDVCPAKSKEVVKHKAINMEPKLPHLDVERANYEAFLALPEAHRPSLKLASVKGSQLLEPLFEYSGACSGCGETPYLKLASQLFGPRMMVANATGCSSIYGGNLPTTPWTTNAEGRGPSWINSLFEDNAEFGLGLRLAADHGEAYAKTLLVTMSSKIGEGLVKELLEAKMDDEAGLRAQWDRVAALKKVLAGLGTSEAKALTDVADHLVKRSVWIIGGDGWAYDIGFGGLDHVLASGRNVNILVLDTEVYSNTGGQASKATPRGAVAKFAASGKGIKKKDLGMVAMTYGDVYVAQVALGANPLQTIKAFNEAESYPGVSLIIAYSTCIAHGIDMTTSMAHQKDAALSGYWPLFRFDPREAVKDAHPFKLDSKKPTVPFKSFAVQEARFAMLQRSDPERAESLFTSAQKDIDERWSYYEQLAGVARHGTDANLVDMRTGNRASDEM
ncbi:pyruvate:ferredoxin (flavodoxin) oxidoreductase [Myxococcota bacterium]|nr:pyruvate:ferredoxin (flavodoxin) oxidoreductase [Myxococcota bacterium]